MHIEIHSFWRKIWKKKSRSKIFRMGWVGFWKSYVIFRVGHSKCLRLLTRWVGGVKKGQKHAYIIFEWSLSQPKAAFLPLQGSKLSNFKAVSISKQFSVTEIQIFSFKEKKCSSGWSYDKNIFSKLSISN